MKRQAHRYVSEYTANGARRAAATLWDLHGRTEQRHCTRAVSGWRTGRFSLAQEMRVMKTLANEKRDYNAECFHLELCLACAGTVRCAIRIRATCRTVCVRRTKWQTSFAACQIAFCLVCVCLHKLRDDTKS